MKFKILLEKIKIYSKVGVFIIHFRQEKVELFQGKSKF